MELANLSTTDFKVYSMRVATPPEQLKAVVLDWAGTALDYGCMGPAAVFLEVFAQFGIAVSVAEARRFMGLAKKEHIHAMCALSKVQEQWQAKYGCTPNESDVDHRVDPIGQ